MKLFPHDGIGSSIMDLDDPENLDQPALATISLAYQLKDAFEVIVVSDETFTAQKQMHRGRDFAIQWNHDRVALVHDFPGARGQRERNQGEDEERKPEQSSHQRVASRLI